MKRLIYLFIFLFIFSQPVFADDKSDVDAMLRERMDNVISLLQKNDMDKQKRNAEILETIIPIFDFEKMGKLSLGRKYWPTLNEEQQKEYTSLFVERIQESYIEKLDLYSDEEAVYEEPFMVKKKIRIMTHLVSKDNDVDMLYKFYKSKRGWKIYDVEIQGVSIVQTYRSQFDGILKKGTVETLLAKLQRSGNFALPDGKK
ncbi:MAG: ABC transporter substrate-binding protein [Proteobacteria bacterium]|nr:ABC transporter substrate-binding protein [Pseudomonadota bacterium]